MTYAETIADHDEALRLITLATNKKAFYASLNQSDLFNDCPLMDGKPLRKSICIKRQKLARRKYGTKFNSPSDRNAVTFETCRTCEVGKKIREGNYEKRRS